MSWEDCNYQHNRYVQNIGGRIIYETNFCFIKSGYTFLVIDIWAGWNLQSSCEDEFSELYSPNVALIVIIL